MVSTIKRMRKQGYEVSECNFEDSISRERYEELFHDAFIADGYSLTKARHYTDVAIRTFEKAK